MPANSWISTSEAVSSVGARVVFTDVDDHYLMDLDDAERKINASTRAIIPVHLYGNAVEMDRVMAIAKKHRLKVLEDCAQSHGATSNGKKAGTFGDCASFSFYPGKNLGAYGDAGAMLTNDDELAENARIIANHGQRSKHNHVMEGRNSRMDGLQAAILGVKLPHLEKWTNQRIAHAGKYNGLIQHPKVIKPQLRDNHRHVFHLYVIRVPDRDGLASYLKERGIDTAVHYPTPLPLLPCYAHMAYSSSDFPVTSAHQSSILSLPMFAELTDEQINYVADSVNAWNA